MSTPSLDYSEVLDYYISSDMAASKRIAAKASKQFVSEIGAAPQRMGEQMTQAMFLEWFLFDYECEPGKTVAASFVEDPPEDMDPALVDELRQVVQTQFTSLFWIDGVAPLLDMVTLEEVRAGTRIALQSARLARNIVPGTKGALGARIAQIDGKWYLPGTPVFYFQAEPTEQLKADLLQEDAEHVPFTSLIFNHYGRD